MKRTVLIVDDDPIFTAFISTLLKEDYEVFTAIDGYSSITTAMNNAPDIILLDVVMPGMTGHEVASALSYLPETMDTPIIFITGQPIDDTRNMPVNVCDCILKSLKGEEIRQIVAKNT
ncbi:MAG: response regulator, partial [Defluviitaleaceae bacterium]|nr:response regulator [Defluviitaleaceae bacterium]